MRCSLTWKIAGQTEAGIHEWSTSAITTGVKYAADFLGVAGIQTRSTTFSTIASAPTLWPYSTLRMAGRKLGSRLFLPHQHAQSRREIITLWVRTASLMHVGCISTTRIPTFSRPRLLLPHQHARHRARAIITLWVARMVDDLAVFQRRACRSPTCTSTPTSRMASGRRMSKSLGNGVDPLDRIQRRPEKPDARRRSTMVKMHRPATQPFATVCRLQADLKKLNSTSRPVDTSDKFEQAPQLSATRSGKSATGFVLSERSDRYADPRPLSGPKTSRSRTTGSSRGSAACIEEMRPPF